MKNRIALIIGVLLLAFLSFAFVQAKINPFDWSAEVRAGMICSIISASIMILTYPKDL